MADPQDPPQEVSGTDQNSYGYLKPYYKKQQEYLNRRQHEDEEATADKAMEEERRKLEDQIITAKRKREDRGRERDGNLVKRLRELEDMDLMIWKEKLDADNDKRAKEDVIESAVDAGNTEYELKNNMISDSQGKQGDLTSMPVYKVSPVVSTAKEPSAVSHHKDKIVRRKAQVPKVAIDTTEPLWQPLFATMNPATETASSEPLHPNPVVARAIAPRAQRLRGTQK